MSLKYPIEILGLVGPKQSGKDTFYKLCLELYCDKRITFTPYRRRFFASGIYEIAEKYKISKIELERTKEKYRKELQDYGVTKRLENPGYFVDELAKNLSEFNHQHPSLIIITDVRFQNEAEFLRQLGAKLIRVVRFKAEEIIDTHISETEQQLIKCDNVIHNNESELRYKCAILDLLKQYNIT